MSKAGVTSLGKSDLRDYLHEIVKALRNARMSDRLKGDEGGDDSDKKSHKRKNNP